ncbi:MAG: hypothetical protein NZV14_09180 [Bryobacteraceae bacterium]|nr:hypothetical protein [Bryobacteraceae bacterium]MDW8378323.1 hypothetical protein [Bryobacterales bacterium]
MSKDTQPSAPAASNARLKLRPEHLEAMAKPADAVLVSEICEHLRQTQAGAVGALSADTLKARVEVGIVRARTHGLRSERAIREFVAYMFAVAPNFDEHATVRQTLADSSIEADRRLELLRERMSPEDWKAAQALADPSAWERPQRSRA